MTFSYSALSWTTEKHLRQYLQLWPGCSFEEGQRIAQEAVVYHRTSRALRNIPEMCTDLLEQRWYASLAQGKPDYTVYNDVRYAGDLWACWLLYSRRYLRNIGSLIQSGWSPRLSRIADLGCGIGYSTAVLKQFWPAAMVYGTNLEGPQAQTARSIGKSIGFTVEPAIVGQVDLIFASEYFEHFDHPFDHVLDVLQRGSFPRYLIIASTFGSRSVGHFDTYYDERGYAQPGKSVGRQFNALLRAHGYRMRKTSFWNNRPAIWERI